MTVTSRVEIILFKFTRGFALVGAAVGIVAIAGFLWSFGSGEDSAQVSLGDINPASSAGTAGGSIVPTNVDIPPIVKEYMVAENSEVLQGWLNTLKDDEQRQDFLNNLADVIVAAKKAKIDDITPFINGYKTIKMERLDGNQFAAYERAARKTALAAGALGFAFFVALMSLILVLLAIERNTRSLAPAKAAAALTPDMLPRTQPENQQDAMRRHG